MREYLWETHMHTSESSRCGQDSALHMVRAYKDAGYQGVVVTDHFVNANCHAPKDGAWQDRITIFLKGYKAAKEAGDALGLIVLPGIEYYFQGGDFLTFGVGEAFLRDQPDLADIDLAEYILRVHAAGGMVSQAHPFREAWYMPPTVEKRYDVVDAVEVLNASHTEEEAEWDQKALSMAGAHGLIKTAGSDAHSVKGAAKAALAFDISLHTQAEFLQALRSRKGRPLRLGV